MEPPYIFNGNTWAAVDSHPVLLGPSAGNGLIRCSNESLQSVLECNHDVNGRMSLHIHHRMKGVVYIRFSKVCCHESMVLRVCFVATHI